MHLKRQKAPKNWPISRKGKKFIVTPKFGAKEGIPILVVLRDLLKIAKTRKEVKRAIHLKNVFVNDRPAKDERNSLFLLDTLSLIPMKKHYRIILSEKGKFDLEEISEEETSKKIFKVMNKKVLKGKKIQLNLSGGRNVLSDTKCNVGDSVLIDFKEGKIKECISFGEKSKVLVIAGKHAGKKGTIKEIKQEGMMAEIDSEKNMFNVLTKQMMAIK